LVPTRRVGGFGACLLYAPSLMTAKSLTTTGLIPMASSPAFVTMSVVP
jgi:hypothetical protein